FAVTEFTSKSVGKANHRFGVRGDAAAVKCRLREAALAEPEVTLAGEQAVAEQPLVGLKDASLGELPRLIDEDFFDQHGITDEEDVIVEGAQHDNVAVLALEPAQVFERVAGVIAIEATPGIVGGAWRNFAGQLGLHKLMLSGR